MAVLALVELAVQAAAALEDIHIIHSARALVKAVMQEIRDVGVTLDIVLAVKLAAVALETPMAAMQAVAAAALEF
jgi:hypothetical protein